jgi:hypothetical protein
LGVQPFGYRLEGWGIRSSALEFVAYSPGFFHDGHRAASDCRATLHALAQPLPGTGRLALQALLEQARLPTWRLWASEAPIEKKDVLKTRGYAWSPGEFGRPKCWYRDVSDANKVAEVYWLREYVMGLGQAVWALRITARNRYSDRSWSWGGPLGFAIEGAVVAPGRRWSSVMKLDVFGRGATIRLLAAPQRFSFEHPRINAPIGFSLSDPMQPTS